MTPRSRDQGQTNNAIHLSHLQMIIFSPPAHCGQVMASEMPLTAIEQAVVSGLSRCPHHVAPRSDAAALRPLIRRAS